MKIGILTFHWGTNYGGILQAWCLQEYLSEQGHEVKIINYKPKQFDISLLRTVIHPSLWKQIPRILISRKKEQLLGAFRKRYLNTTKRFYSAEELGGGMDCFDAFISGSDQVLNPGFTLSGDNGKPSSVYWLNIGGKNVRKLGYAVSFGCEDYPDAATPIAKQWVKMFDAIGVREQTGLQILEQLEYDGFKTILPDPTILQGKDLFEKLGIRVSQKQEEYTCVYMLRHEIVIPGNVRYIDEKHRPLTMEQWLTMICSSKSIITNSYHGTLMAIFAHVPFSVLLETGRRSGMNDRFHTLMEVLGCEDRIAHSIKEALDIVEKPIDFQKLDMAVNEYRELGVSFLRSQLSHHS